MKYSGLLVLACAAALTVGCNGNNRNDNRIADRSNTVGTAGSGVSASDKNFVDQQLADGMAEIETAKLAKEHAQNPAVKQFAQMMIDDHTKAGNELKQLATTYSIPQPTQMDDKHRDLMDKLSKLNAADFDKAYMKAMVDDHEDAVRDLRSRVDEKRSLSEQVQGKNPENRAAVKPEASDDRTTMSINRWAANTLPTVEHHLNRAKELEDQVDHPNATARTTPEKKGTERRY